jgi:arylsulfatase A-like enzyme
MMKDLMKLFRHLQWFSVAVLLGALPSAQAKPRQPDILLIMPDQFRGDCLSAVGHPVVRTPNLDKLARDGGLFRRAYSTVPSCIPARHSLLTGQFPTTSGVVGYKARPIKVPTLPQLLNDAGYSTILVGRYMHQVPQDESYGYQKEIRGSTYVNGDDYDNFLRKAAPDSGGIRSLTTELGISANGWRANPWPLAEELHPTDWAVNQDRKVIKDAPADKPLFLTASFFAPHPPLFPPKKYYDYYYNSKKLPAPAHGNWVNWDSLTEQGNKQGDRVLLKGEILQATLAGYFGLIEHLDAQLGPLIADFKARSAKAGRPWLILVIADHGEMLGDHGYFRKCEPFEGSANIPMIVCGSPELGFKAGTVSHDPVCLEDIMPTLLAAAGAVLPKPCDGQDLGRILRGGKTGIRSVLHSEHAPCYNQEQAFQALTDGHFKYIWRPLDGREHLFDLDRDIHEENDLAKDASREGDLVSWRKRMIKELANRPEGFTDGQKLIPGRPYPPIQRKSGAV